MTHKQALEDVVDAQATQIRELQTQLSHALSRALAAESAVEAMIAAMGEEWARDEVGDKGQVIDYCVECRRIYGDFFEGHTEECHRGRFFASLSLSAPVGNVGKTMEAAEAAIQAVPEWDVIIGVPVSTSFCSFGCNRMLMQGHAPDCKRQLALASLAALRERRT